MRHPNQLPWPDLRLSPIVESDLPLYREFFRNDGRRDCYGNSWAYITQACRGLGLGWKFCDGDVLLSIGMHRNHYIIVRPLGRLDARFVELAETLRARSRLPVFVKKLFPDQVHALQSLGPFMPVTSEGYTWDEPAWADDDTYPEQIFDIDLTLALELGSRRWTVEHAHASACSEHPPDGHAMARYYGEFRHKVRRFSAIGLNCFLETYRPESEAAVRDFCASYFGPDRFEAAAAYGNMLTTHRDGFFRFVARLEGVERYVGLFVAERLDEDSAGSYASLLARQPQGLPEYLFTLMLRRLREEGIRRLNAGGSETSTLNHFKLKRGPVDERPMTMLVYGANG